MNKNFKRGAASVLALLLSLIVLAGCTSSGDQTNPASKDNKAARKAALTTNGNFVAPKISHFVEYNNYVKKYKLDDDPNNILWCTSSFPTTNAPLITVPIAGKLTSSSVSLFPSVQNKFGSGGGDHSWSTTYNPELPQADGMYHGSPPAYRYGFTPGGQYVDFTGMAVFCTTALTKFQKDKTEVDVSYDAAAGTAQTQAEADLAKCQAEAAKGKSATPSERCAAAQKTLEGIAGGHK